MTRKQLLALLLVLASILCTFTGCNDETSYTSGRKTSNKSTHKYTTPNSIFGTLPETDPTLFDSNPFDPIPNEPAVIDLSRASYVSCFSEGLAFVRIGEPSKYTYCINKNGHIVFTLPGEYEPKSGFYNGLALLKKDPSSTRKDSLYLCDSFGHITSAADLGGTHFLYDIEDTFYGGYILIANSTTTFTGSTETLGILNFDLEYIVKPSQELYALYYDTYFDDRYNPIMFYDGYLFSNDFTYGHDKYLDLRTGIEESGRDNLFAKINMEFKSDFWHANRRKGYFYYDQRYQQSSDNIMIDLRQYQDTLSTLGSFHNGTAPLQFVVESAIGYDGYFTILDENGEFQFDPVRTEAEECTVLQDGAMYLLKSASYDSVYLALFDGNGLRKEFRLESYVYPAVYFSDGVILVYDLATGYQFYSTDFEPLF